MPLLAINNGLNIYYELAGPTLGQPIVFLSGLTGDHNNWQLQVQSLSGDYRCLTFDWRDTGQSGASSPGEYTLADMAGDVAALIEGLQLGRCHLVGLSMGGAVAQEVGLGYPQVVASLTLASSFCLRPDGIELPPDKRTPGNLRHAAAVRFHDTSERLRQLASVPVQVVAGSRDRATPPEAQKAYAALIPAAEFVLIEGAGHYLHLEKAGAFNRQLRSFLAAHPV